MRFLFFLCLSISNISLAAAWMQPSKSSELIFQSEYKVLTTYHNNSNTPSKFFHFFINDVFYQYGINDKLMLGVQTKWYNYDGYEQFSAADDPSYNFFDSSEQYMNSEYKDQENFPYETKVFIQTPLWQNESSIISIQPNLSFYTKELYRSGGLTLLYGRDFQIGTKTGFINLETGFDQSYSTAYRFDATIGYAINSRNMIMIQSFNHYNVMLYDTYVKHERHANDIRIMYVHKYTKGLSLQTGYAENISQRRNYVSQSIIAGLSIQF